MLPLESTCPTMVTLSNPSPHSTILPTNQILQKTYFKRNLKKGVESPVVQIAPVQDSEPIRDQGMIDSINSHSNNRMSENDRSEMNSTNLDLRTDGKASENNEFETAVLEDMCEQGNIDRFITDGEERIDDSKVVAKHTEKETKSNHFGNTSKCDPSLDLPIALRKGTRSCTKHSISNYVSYDNLLLQFRAFTVNLDSTTIPKSIHLPSEYPKWKVAIMEEMRALEKNKTV